MKPFSKRAMLLLLATLNASPLLAANVEPAPAAEVSDAIRKVFPALVLIHVVMEEGAEGRMKKMEGSGSGTIISPEGHVLTNHHVAGRGTRFVCVLSNREEVDATLVGTDALADLSVLKLDLSTRRFKDQPLAVATFGDSDALKTGDVVYAMGSPGGLSQSVTRGIVANTAMIVPRGMSGLTLDGENVGELVRWIGHDAVIFPGNSGGPLVNPAGEIVGVNEVGIASLGGAIPANLARKISAQLIEKGAVTRSWIGVEIQPLLRSMTDKKGALVATVWKNSPADKAGIKPGDFIHTYQGQAIPDSYAPEDIPVFNAMVLNTDPGAKVELSGMRDSNPTRLHEFRHGRHDLMLDRGLGSEMRDESYSESTQRRKDEVDHDDEHLRNGAGENFLADEASCDEADGMVEHCGGGKDQIDLAHHRWWQVADPCAEARPNEQRYGDEVFQNRKTQQLADDLVSGGQRSQCLRFDHPFVRLAGDAGRHTEGPFQHDKKALDAQHHHPGEEAGVGSVLFEHRLERRGKQFEGGGIIHLGM